MVKLSQYLVLKYLELEETIKYWLQSDAGFKPCPLPTSFLGVENGA